MANTKVDIGSKLIKTYTVMDASVHDYQAVGDLMEKDDEGQNLFDDSAYVGVAVSNLLEDSKMTAQLNECAYRGKLRYVKLEKYA